MFINTKLEIKQTVYLVLSTPNYEVCSTCKKPLFKGYFHTVEPNTVRTINICITESGVTEECVLSNGIRTNSIPFLDIAAAQARCDELNKAEIDMNKYLDQDVIEPESNKIKL